MRKITNEWQCWRTRDEWKRRFLTSRRLKRKNRTHVAFSYIREKISFPSIDTFDSERTWTFVYTVTAYAHTISFHTLFKCRLTYWLQFSKKFLILIDMWWFLKCLAIIFYRKLLLPHMIISYMKFQYKYLLMLSWQLNLILIKF